MEYRSDTEFSIIKAYVDLMSEMPYEKIRVKQLVERCGVARSTFYQYFQDSYDLLEQLERRLLGELGLYVGRSTQADGTIAGMPFQSMERWFEACISARRTLRALLGDNGDRYFESRLKNQIRRDLNRMMDDDRAPKDKLRPYYVEMLTAAYLGMMTYVISVDDTDELISTHDIAVIANSTRAEFYLLDDRAPEISDERLFGEDAGTRVQE